MLEIGCIEIEGVVHAAKASRPSDQQSEII